MPAIGERYRLPNGTWGTVEDRQPEQKRIRVWTGQGFVWVTVKEEKE